MKNILEFYKKLCVNGEPEIRFNAALDPILKNLI